MKKWFIHILLLAGLFGMLTTSCSQDEEIANIPSAGTPSEKVTIRFTLDLGEQGGMSSRATWGGYDGVGTDETDAENGDYTYENHIDLDKLQVLVLDLNGSYVGSVDLDNSDRDETNNGRKYTFDGKLNVPKSFISNQRLKCKLMVIANYDGSVVDDNGEINLSSVFNYNHNNYSSNAETKKYIPMWGITTYTGTNNEGVILHPDIIQELDEPIYMLRSMAKIEVRLSDNVYTNNYRITGVTLNKYVNQGNVFPSFKADGVSSSTSLSALSSTTDLGEDEVMNEVSAVSEGNGINIASFPSTSVFTTSPSYNFTNYYSEQIGKSFVIYVPEMINDGTYEMYLRLAKNDVDITGNVMSGKPTIKLKKYKDGKVDNDATSQDNIIRNHCYRYTINSISDGMNITLAVAPWTDVTESFNYQSELSYNEGTWTNISKTTGNTIELKTSSDANASNVTGVYNFQINTPLTIEWMAVLEDPSMKFQFDMANTSGEGTAAGNAVQRTVKGELLVTGSNLSLGVKAVDPSESGQYEAKLRVYVTYNGKTIELDLVDGRESTLEHFTIQHSKL